MKSYQRWSKGTACGRNTRSRRARCSIDTVAIYLAFSEQWLKMERIGIRTQWGFTIEDPNAKKMNVATDWKSGGLKAFEEHLARRLCSRSRGR